MPTFLLMTKLSADQSRQVKDRERLGRVWLDQVREKCPGVKFIAHYGLLGPYDFCDVYEAPDVETAAKVSMISLANGAMTAESWVAIPYTQLMDLSQEI